MGSLKYTQNVPIFMGPDAENVRIGKVRPSMKKNELLQKMEVEKPKNRCRDLPGYGYVYGVASRKDGGVAEALNGWASVRSKPLKCHDQAHRVKSFIDMNRSAAVLGLTNARDQEIFRKKHPMLTLNHPMIRGPRQSYWRVPTDITFGRPNIRHAPMFEILQNKFQNDFIAEKLLQNTRETNVFLPKRVSLGEVKEMKEKMRDFDDDGSGNAATPDPPVVVKPDIYGECDWCKGPIYEDEVADKVDCTNGCGRMFHKSCVEKLNPDFDRANWICPKCQNVENCAVCTKEINEDDVVARCVVCGVAAHDHCTKETRALDGTWTCPQCTHMNDVTALVSKLSSLEIAAETACQRILREYKEGKWKPRKPKLFQLPKV